MDGVITKLVSKHIIGKGILRAIECMKLDNLLNTNYRLSKMHVLNCINHIAMHTHQLNHFTCT